MTFLLPALHWRLTAGPVYRLAGERAERIVASLPKGKTMSWPMVVRTVVLDELIQKAVQRDGVDTVLNLAAGLDTRPYRLPLPRELRWIEVDFPDMIAYKQEQLAGVKPVCTLEQVGLDLTETARRQANLHSLFLMSVSQPIWSRRHAKV